MSLSNENNRNPPAHVRSLTTYASALAPTQPKSSVRSSRNSRLNKHPPQNNLNNSTNNVFIFVLVEMLTPPPRYSVRTRELRGPKIGRVATPDVTNKSLNCSDNPRKYWTSWPQWCPLTPVGIRSDFWNWVPTLKTILTAGVFIIRLLVE